MLLLRTHSEKRVGGLVFKGKSDKYRVPEDQVLLLCLSLAIRLALHCAACSNYYERAEFLLFNQIYSVFILYNNQSVPNG